MIVVNKLINLLVFFKSMADLFVYGTLMFPEVVKELTGNEFITKKAAIAGYVRYGINGIPGIIKKKKSKVTGKLLLDVDNESLNKITFFEGKEYDLNQVITLQNKVVKTFIWNSQIETKIEWIPEEFERNIETYIHEVVIPSKIQYQAKHF